MSSDKKIRVRFAPSPTGPLHIGGLRTAIYNYLFAKQNQGTFILRIEDTDRTRFVPGAEEYIKETLQWCGIEPDVSPNNPDNLGPYRQSERKDFYKELAEKLVADGKAYYAFDTAEELDEMREKLKKAGAKQISYNAISRRYMKNSLTLPANEVEERLKSGEPYVIRLKVPLKKEIRFYDIVRGWVTFHSSQIDDKILLKSDGMPTYHLANVTDDHAMQITHVIRGEEWIPSTPIHILLYEAFGWEPPKFAHLPLILRPDGKGKLSKRDAEQGGFPVFPLEWKDPKTGAIAKGYREEGFLPEALINFLVLLGWHPSGNKEILSLQELIKEFALERIGKGGVKFDYKKALWINQTYLKQKDNSFFLPLLKNTLKEKKLSTCFNDEKLLAIIETVKERLKTLKDLFSETEYFFLAPTSFDEKLVSKKFNEVSKDFLLSLQVKIKDLQEWTQEKISELLKSLMSEKEVKPGQVLPIVRMAISGKKSGPDLHKIIYVLGKDETLQRINNFLVAV